MTKITYEIVQHDGGWAYRVDQRLPPDTHFDPSPKNLTPRQAFTGYTSEALAV
jgi:hypothetical protein